MLPGRNRTKRLQPTPTSLTTSTSCWPRRSLSSGPTETANPSLWTSRATTAAASRSPSEKKPQVKTQLSPTTLTRSASWSLCRPSSSSHLEPASPPLWIARATTAAAPSSLSERKIQVKPAKGNFIYKVATLLTVNTTSQINGIFVLNIKKEESGENISNTILCACPKDNKKSEKC